MNFTNATQCFEAKGVDENYWNWRNILVNILAVLIIVSNTALILVIRGDQELRKQVSSGPIRLTHLPTHIFRGSVSSSSPLPSPTCFVESSYLSTHYGCAGVYIC